MAGVSSVLLWVRLPTGGYDSPDQICTNTPLAFLKVANHFFEVQWPDFFLDMCVTGLLPCVLSKTPMQAMKLAENDLLTGWNKGYAAGITFNTFYQVVSGMDKS
jgi:hypothetical protein